MTEFNYVKKGQRLEIPTAAFHNAIVDVIRSNISIRKGFQDNASSGMKGEMSRRRTIEVYAFEDIERYSIFTVCGDSLGTGTEPEGYGTGTGHCNHNFEWEIPRVSSELIVETTESDVVYVTNYNTEMANDEWYQCWIVGDEQPFPILYGGTDTGTGTGSGGAAISPGDALGVVPGTYQVSEDYTGLRAVSTVNLEDGIVWVVRVWRTSQFIIGKVITDDINADSYGIVEKHNEFWSASGVEYTVYNPQEVVLEVGLKVRWSKYPGWNDWIVEPWHWFDCEDLGTA